MKKIIVSKMNQIALFMMLIILFSCSKDGRNDEKNNLQLKIVNIESNIITGNFYKTETYREIKNSVFFNKLLELKKIENQEEWDQKLNELSSNQFSSSQFQKSPRPNMDIKLTSEEKIIYYSLARALRMNDENSIDILEYYLNEISCFDIDDKIKKSCVDKITFYKDALIYFNFDKAEKIYLNSENKGVNEIAHKKWDCPYRDCLDCCINSKLQDLEDNNLVDWVKTIVTFPENLLWMVGSCGWDCIFHND